MTKEQAAKQAADYRAAAFEYRKSGDTFVANQFLLLANRLDAIMKMVEEEQGADA